MRNLLGHEFINNKRNESIVLIHAFGGNRRAFKKQIESLSKEYNLLLIDLNGHGESMLYPLHNEEDQSFEFITSEVIQVMDIYKIKKAHFIGLSLGTMVCAVMVKIYPERMISVVSMGDATNCTFKFKLLIPLGWLSQFVMHYKITYLFFAYMLIPGKVHKVSRKFLIREAMKIGHKEFFAWYNLLAKFYKTYPKEDFIGKVPTQYIMGEHDVMFVKACKKMHKQNYNSEFSIIEGAGHLVNIDSPESVNEKIMAFLKREDICRRPAKEIKLYRKIDKRLSVGV